MMRMRNLQIFQALVCGFVLAITGCSSDPQNGGTGGSGGTTAKASSCDAICAGNCIILDGAVNPNDANCKSACTSVTDPDGQLDDTCGSEMEAWLACAEAKGAPPACNFNPLSCPTEFAAWDDCNDSLSGAGGSGGSGGSNGTGGSGGSAGPASSCDAICADTCILLDGAINPNEATCASDCTSATDPDGGLDDTCGSQMVNWLDCAKAKGAPPACNFNPLSCPSEFADWDDCNI